MDVRALGNNRCSDGESAAKDDERQIDAIGEDRKGYAPEHDEGGEGRRGIPEGIGCEVGEITALEFRQNLVLEGLHVLAHALLVLESAEPHLVAVLGIGPEVQIDRR